MNASGNEKFLRNGEREISGGLEIFAIDKCNDWPAKLETKENFFLEKKAT
jgi:hypothetical protein